MHSKEPCIQSKQPYTPSKKPCIDRKRNQYTLERGLHTERHTSMSSRDSALFTLHPSKEPYIHSKKPKMLPKESHIHSKDPHIQPKKTTVINNRYKTQELAVLSPRFVRVVNYNWLVRWKGDTREATEHTRE